MFMKLPWRYERIQSAHETWSLVCVTNLDGRLFMLADNTEGEELGISLHRRIGESSPDQPLNVEDGVLGVGSGLVLRGIADQALSTGRVPRDVRRPAVTFTNETDRV